MPINFYIWSGAFAFIAVFGIGLFVLTRDPYKKTNRIFCAFTLAIAGWCVGSFLGNIIADPSLALWTMRINYLFGVWVPTLYVQFIYSLSEKGESARQRKQSFFIVCSAILSFLVFTPFFIPSLRQISGYSFLISRPGPVYYGFFIFFSLAMVEVIYQTFRALQSRSGLEFRQFKFVAAANVLAILAGFEYFLRVFGFFSRPPLDDYLLVAYALVLAYGVTRHRLFDVDALVRAFRKERLATLGLLASSINHEIKNPLFVIRGLLDGCMEKKSGLSSETEIMLKKVYSQVERISQVIARINRLAKDEAVKKKAFTECAVLADAFEAASEVVSLVKSGKEVRVICGLSKELPLLAISPGELEEVLINLLANAYDAITAAGEICIKAEQKQKKIAIEILDNGKGIAKDVKRQMFRPFFTTKGNGGVGLGLYLTKEIIERRGGRISIKPNVSSGTCFYIELPAI